MTIGKIMARPDSSTGGVALHPVSDSLRLLRLAVEARRSAHGDVYDAVRHAAELSKLIDLMSVRASIALAVALENEAAHSEAFASGAQPCNPVGVIRKSALFTTEDISISLYGSAATTRIQAADIMRRLISEKGSQLEECMGENALAKMADRKTVNLSLAMDDFIQAAERSNMSGDKAIHLQSALRIAKELGLGTKASEINKALHGCDKAAQHTSNWTVAGSESASFDAE